MTDLATVEVGQPLTLREAEAVRRFAQLGSIKLVALDMGISYWTVKNYLTAVYHKLDVDNGIEAFRALGWLLPLTHEHRWRCDCGAIREP